VVQQLQVQPVATLVQLPEVVMKILLQEVDKIWILELTVQLLVPEEVDLTLEAARRICQLPSLDQHTKQETDQELEARLEKNHQVVSSVRSHQVMKVNKVVSQGRRTVRHLISIHPDAMYKDSQKQETMKVGCILHCISFHTK